MENKNTKDRILDAALELFNKKGIADITVRHIAAAIDISHGNLCYHYPTKDEVIYALYQKLVAEFDSKLEELEHKEMSFSETIESSQFAIGLFYRYRFLMLDFVSIMRTDDRIKLHYKELMKMRKVQFRLLFDKCMAAGVMRKELHEGEFDNLVVLFAIVGDFWISHSEIHFEGNEEEKLAYYNRIMFSIFSPYLTPEGWAEMMK